MMGCDMMGKIVKLKNEKMEYLNNIYEITMKQKEALESEDLEMLQKLIYAKQAYMDKVDKINETIEQLEEKYISEIDENCKKILTAIRQIDDFNRKKANIIFSVLKEKIGNIRQGKKVYNTYNPSYSNSAFFNKVR
jgi:endonuclease III